MITEQLCIFDVPTIERKPEAEDWRQRLTEFQTKAPAILNPTPRRMTVKIKDGATASKLEALATAMQSTIDGKLADRLTNTPKRLGQAMNSRMDGERLARTQQAMRKLAALHRTGEVSPTLRDLRTKKAIYDLMAESKQAVPNGYHTYHTGTGEPISGASDQALELWALLSGKTDEELKADKLAELMRGLQFSKIVGYFPTPAPLAARMVELAQIEAHHAILEPSAGSGAIVDAIEAEQPEAMIVVYEINPTLCNVLQAKGYDARPVDFLEAGGTFAFDRVLMNPPFESMQDVDHVIAAFERLKSGGRLVSIMSPSPFFRTGKKAEAFRAWIEELTAEVIDLPDGSFKESGTGTNAKLVIIDKD